MACGIVHQRDGGVDDLGEVVRRNLGRHADGDAVGAVDQKIRNARGQNLGLDFAVVVVGTEVDGLFVEVFEQRGGDLRELGFGVTVGGGRIAVDGAEVALSEHQRVAHAPGLREAHQGVVDGEVAVGMVFAHHVADDAGALAGGAVGRKAHLLHRVENAAMHGLQSVAHVGQRAADDDRHRIVEIRPAHLVFDVDGLNVQGAGGAAVAGRWS